jgi:protein gp37
MSADSEIEWTDGSWSPVTGCDEMSAGCDNCYARPWSERLRRMGSAKYAAGFAVRVHPECLDEPRHWRTPRLIFTCSMSDLFHAKVGYDFDQQVGQVMAELPRHTFLVLTKRPERMARLTQAHGVPPNVWLGTSVEDQRVLHRIDTLRTCPATVRFLSCEPLIGPLPDLDLSGISWVIVGGESGPRHRPIDPAWVRDLRDQCVARGIPLFFKQWGGRTPKAGGRLLDGRLWNQYPDGKGGIIDLGQEWPLPRGLTIKRALEQAIAAHSQGDDRRDERRQEEGFHVAG